jgi:hypothetical protein
MATSAERSNASPEDLFLPGALMTLDAPLILDSIGK